MKNIKVCNHCGSADIVFDAWAHVNDLDSVRVFDEMGVYCKNCSELCQPIKVDVPDSFDETGDVFDLKGLK